MEPGVVNDCGMGGSHGPERLMTVNTFSRPLTSVVVKGLLVAVSPIPRIRSGWSPTRRPRMRRGSGPMLQHRQPHRVVVVLIEVVRAGRQVVLCVFLVQPWQAIVVCGAVV